MIPFIFSDYFFKKNFQEYPVTRSKGMPPVNYVIKLKLHPIYSFMFLVTLETLSFSPHLSFGKLQESSILSVKGKKSCMPGAELYMLFHLILITVL